MRLILCALIGLVFTMPSVNANEYWVSSVNDGFGYFSPRPVVMHLCCPDDWANYTDVTRVERNDRMEAMHLAARNPRQTRADMALADWTFSDGTPNGDWALCTPPLGRRGLNGPDVAYLWQRDARPYGLGDVEDLRYTSVASSVADYRVNPTVMLHYLRTQPPRTHLVWEADTNYTMGDIVAPVAGSTLRFVAQVSGDSGATPPTWPETYGATVADGATIWLDANASDRCLLSLGAVLDEFGTETSYVVRWDRATRIDVMRRSIDMLGDVTDVTLESYLIPAGDRDAFATAPEMFWTVVPTNKRLFISCSELPRMNLQVVIDADVPAGRVRFGVELQHAYAFNLDIIHYETSGHIVTDAQPHTRTMALNEAPAVARVWPPPPTGVTVTVTREDTSATSRPRYRVSWDTSAHADSGYIPVPVQAVEVQYEGEWNNPIPTSEPDLWSDLTFFVSKATATVRKYPSDREITVDLDVSAGVPAELQTELDEFLALTPPFCLLNYVNRDGGEVYIKERYIVKARGSRDSFPEAKYTLTGKGRAAMWADMALWGPALYGLTVPAALTKVLEYCGLPSTMVTDDSGITDTIPDPGWGYHRPTWVARGESAGGYIARFEEAFGIVIDDSDDDAAVLTVRPGWPVSTAGLPQIRTAAWDDGDRDTSYEMLDIQEEQRGAVNAVRVTAKDADGNRIDGYAALTEPFDLGYLAEHVVSADSKVRTQAAADALALTMLTELTSEVRRLKILHPFAWWSWPIWQQFIILTSANDVAQAAGNWQAIEITREQDNAERGYADIAIEVLAEEQ